MQMQGLKALFRERTERVVMFFVVRIVQLLGEKDSDRAAD
jgi:hypothetical protein